MRSFRFLLALGGILLALTTIAGAQTPSFVVTAGWLADRVTDPAVSILHVGANRTIYDAGHIPGARFVPLEAIVIERDGTPNEIPPAPQLAALFEKLGIGDSGPIVIYGDEKGLHAARMFFTLDYLGHSTRAAVLDGGLEKWRSEGRDISTAVTAWPPRPFTPRIHPDVVVTLPAVRDISWSIARDEAAPWRLLDARPEAQFSGAEPGDGISRPGHIPGAASFFWQRAIAGPDNPVLRPVSELRRLLHDAGVRPGTRVVTYCRTGVQASFAYFVARHLGLDVKMYDGSFIEWSRAAGTEVTRGNP